MRYPACVVRALGMHFRTLYAAASNDSQVNQNITHFLGTHSWDSGHRNLEPAMTILARLLLCCSLVGLLPSLAWSELKVGTVAPAFSAKAAQGGTDVTFMLSEALKKGPVVVYFYPKSFTSVCTEEAHLFAEAMPEFEKLGSSVIGISTDSIETQRKFSQMACRDKFPVAADPEGNVVKAYDTLIWFGVGIVASRTSYVITPDGKIASVLTAGDAESHIQSALKSVKAWKARKAR
jgi:thioredoxin-dependent peroxiredoxin